MAVFRVKQGKQAREFEVDSIDIGTRSLCAVTLEDRVASARHALVAAVPGGFVVSDLGSATGTWLNGAEVASATPLSAGDALVLGCTRIMVAAVEGGARLELELDARPFHFEPSSSHRDEQGKLVVGGDAERLVRDEVSFTRLRGLKLANLLALAASACVALALFVPGMRDAAFDPGPLASPHARLFDASTASGDDEWHARHRAVAQEQGCSACHDTLGGTSVAKCAQCHAELAERNHPFVLDRSADPATASIELDDDACASCHMDHSGAQPAPGVFVPEASSLQASCAGCHPAGTPELRRLPRDLPDEPHKLAWDRFPHAPHADQSCSTCHARDASAADGGRDFARTSFATCMGCHSADEQPGPANAWGRDPALAAQAAKVKPEHRVRLSWHGSDAKDASGAARCLDCHAELHRPELRSAPVEEPSSISFELARRGHAELYAAGVKVPDGHGAGRACVECHASGRPGHAGETRTAPFQHATHLSSVHPAGDAQAASLSLQCAQCHAEQAAAVGLAAGEAMYSGPPLDSCAACHREERDGKVEPLVRGSKPAGPNARRERVQFPHGLHLASASFGKEGVLARGCFACHEFSAGSDAFDARPATRPEASACLPCHDDHARVGGPASSGCSMCHDDPAARQGAVATPDPAWRAEPVVRQRPATRGYSHWSRGHAPTMEKGSCADCHDNAASARTVSAMNIPSESQPACVECHLRERFHWLGAPAGTGR